MHYKMLIGGQWGDARNSKTWQVINPATEEPIANVPFGDADDADAAIEAAHAAQPQWAAMTPYERGAILRRVAELIRERLDDLAPIMTRECGKPLAESRGEWNASADLWEWMAEEGKRAYGRLIPGRRSNKRLLAVTMPLGVVATITAWNFPALLPSRKWAASLAAGCAVVGRPSELTPLSAMALANLLVEAGIPAGVFNLVNGDPVSIGESFMYSPLVDKISFTGSQRVGSLLMSGASKSFKRLALELGGSAPVLVFDDYDVEAAARLVAGAKFRNNGQVCIAPARIYVQQRIYEDFLEATQTTAESLVVGDGMQPGITVGPMVTAAGRERVESFVQDAVAKGAQVITGGGRVPGLKRGYFYQPTIMTNVLPTMRLSCEEVFGPVLPVSPFDTIEEGLQLANDSPFGLAAFAITKDMTRATRVYEGLKAGVVGINDLTPSTAEAPFGGMKQSGFGREGAVEGLHEYMDTKFVSIALD
ncbi:MAG: NAD-dependent succinate-semialdehyde dehydrogenase [Anaerolineae bacterium]|nr:NAD-dependent succinate-semialdehyde dehydrogenase [Anaerolineae bacterium]